MKNILTFNNYLRIIVKNFHFDDWICRRGDNNIVNSTIHIDEERDIVMLSVYWFFAILPMDYYQDQQGCTAIWPDAEHQVSVTDTMLFSILINRTRLGWAYPSAAYLRSLFFFPLTPKIVFTSVPLMYVPVAVSH